MNCPKCDSENIEEGKPEERGNKGYAKVECKNCGYSYTTSYDVVEIKIWEEAS